MRATALEIAEPGRKRLYTGLLSIALGLAMAQAAELKIDSTPAEGFSSEVVDEILNLRAEGLRSVLLLPLGYRAESGDWLVNLAKVRRSTTDFIVRR